MTVTETTQAPAKPQLGLVCITASDAVRYRTVTRTRLRSFPEEEQRRMLAELYADNIKTIAAAVEFCAAREIKLYRLTSGTFPFADDPIGEPILEGFAADLRRVGERAMATGLRIVMHPDQFVVLSSDAPAVVANSIKILALHARTLDLLAQPRSAWAAMTIHGGKGDRAERLIENIKALPDEIRLRLVLENDEYTYGATEMLAICRAAGVPMVFDAHHHVCHEKLAGFDDPSIAEILAEARTTWPVPEWQMVHISNGREHFNDARHSDLITAMPPAFRTDLWIEVEAKLKEEAIAKLRQDWLGLQVNWPPVEAPAKAKKAKRAPAVAREEQPTAPTTPKTKRVRPQVDAAQSATAAKPTARAKAKA